jgi:hypothetical protein
MTVAKLRQTTMHLLKQNCNIPLALMLLLSTTTAAIAQTTAPSTIIEPALSNYLSSFYTHGKKTDTTWVQSIAVSAPA